jgi:hypothetical protein
VDRDQTMADKVESVRSKLAEDRECG